MNGFHIPIQKHPFYRSVIDGVYAVEEEEISDLENNSDDDLFHSEDEEPDHSDNGDEQEEGG
jgi:hypothetical protein